MKRILALFLLQFAGLVSFAQDQRALLIGIDQYAPPAGYTPTNTDGRSDYENLNGCRNDALSMYSIITSKFSFPEKNIDTLFNESASREAILKSLDQLLGISKPGDIAFLFYAGHGSQMQNSLSFEDDKLDQTIVPANAWKEGIRDIRDKELSKIFNAFLDKKVKLTVIFDCCHSGSLSRGPNIPTGKFRYMPGADYDAKDPSRYPVPETREGDNFLIISSAQSDEKAQEQSDDENIPHGAFTLALNEALNQLSASASAATIFSSARAILKSNGKSQEPVLGGSQERQQQTLFGMSKGKVSDYSYVAVTKVMGTQVRLQGGLALGLMKDNELSMFNEKSDTLYKLRIDTVTGINTSWAIVVKGNASEIKPGYQFRVTNWVSSGRPLLKIYVPNMSVNESQVNQFTESVVKLKRSGKVKWVNTIGRGGQNPYTTLFWTNGKCYAKIDKAAPQPVKDLGVESLLALCKKDSTVYVELPVSPANASLVATRLKENRGLEVVNDPAQAHYMLFSKLDEQDKPSLGLRKVEVSLADSLESMPVQTDCYPLSAGVSAIPEKLNTAALKLAKLRGWLSLMAPDATKNAFGYSLVLYDNVRKMPVTNGQYHIGDKLEMKLVAAPDLASQFQSTKYVYVFGIDQAGTMGLYYPDNDGNVSNKFPKNANGELVKEISLLNFTVPQPSGTDNYFVLATDEPITNPTAVFTQEGVNTSMSRGANDNNPLNDLLDMGNSGSRGVPKKTKSNWSVQRYTFRCSY